MSLSLIAASFFLRHFSKSSSAWTLVRCPPKTSSLMVMSPLPSESMYLNLRKVEWSKAFIEPFNWAEAVVYGFIKTIHRVDKCAGCFCQTFLTIPELPNDKTSSSSSLTAIASLLRRSFRISNAWKALHQAMMDSIFAGFSEEKPRQFQGDPGSMLILSSCQGFLLASQDA